jgi:hypothetical protein
MLMNVVRHHAPDPDDARDLLDYMLETDELDMTRLSILLRHLGRRLPLALGEMKLQRLAASRSVLARIDFGPERDMQWRGGTLSLRDAPLPESMALRIDGRPIGDLIIHPYLDPTMLIANFGQAGGTWRMSLVVPREPG